MATALGNHSSEDELEFLTQPAEESTGNPERDPAVEQRTPEGSAPLDQTNCSEGLGTNSQDTSLPTGLSIGKEELSGNWD